MTPMLHTAGSARDCNIQTLACFAFDRLCICIHILQICGQSWSTLRENRSRNIYVLPRRNTEVNNEHDKKTKLFWFLSFRIMVLLEY